jgi:LmbE family N-acetylglucosaminyl deacetylase
VQAQDLFERATAPETAAQPAPRALLVFAHPDDEVIAIGARLGRFKTARFVHVTDGAPRNEYDSQAHGFHSLAGYRRARAAELRRALALARIPASAQECLGIPDEGASLALPELVKRLYALINEYRPEIVLTHPYEGGHPDHDACAFSVSRAVGLLELRQKSVPLVVESAFYHAGPAGFETGTFLADSNQNSVITCWLDSTERLRKSRLLSCFHTQQETLRSFTAECERFRMAPKYDFNNPAHTPPVLYDKYPWGMTSQRFCELAREADQALQTETVEAGAWVR